MRFTHTFAYGSLLNPASLMSTLPGVDPARLSPARLGGWAREFGVAFPNDGSEEDKAYVDIAGQRPPVVLFANLVSASATTVNGVLVPLEGEDLDRLAARELRYDLVDVTAALRCRVEGVRVGAFVGKPRFTRADQVRRGVVPASYRRTIELGVAHWEAREPGFDAAYRASTRVPAWLQTLDLRRVDGPSSTPAGADAGIDGS